MLPRSLCPLALLVVVVVVVVEAQYEKYSFRGFPLKDIMPLDSAYNYALEQYAAQKWGESVKYLELGLRLHRLLRDSESFCGRNCSAAARRDGAGDGDDTLLADSSLRVVRHILRRAACLKKCKAGFPVFNLSYPKRDLLETFEQRIPYRYIQYAYFQLNNMEKAVAAAHTFLKKNPADPYLTKNMDYYKTLVDVEEYLIDHEEQPYESVFLKSVTLYNSGDFSGSARNMEQAIAQYLEVYGLCLAGCEGSYEILEVKDFYPTLAVNDAKNAAPCAASYVLFDPGDQVMQQNIAYYRFYREQWGLEDGDFHPRPEAQTYFNQTTKQKEMLQFALNYLQTDDEVRCKCTGSVKTEITFYLSSFLGGVKTGFFLAIKRK
uniref:Leprecan-like alpha-helical domain-containing protein n=1 Tax=Scophthalmus maximus TaxID=52904 RepID=A0A8D3AB35_SCOMX